MGLLLFSPPYMYDTLYSSYQNEWDEQKKNRKQKNLNKNNDTNGIIDQYCKNINIIDDEEGTYGIFDDNNVSDLKWVVVGAGNDGDDEDDNNIDNNGIFLLACTSSGEVVSFQVIYTDGSENNKKSNINGNVRESKIVDTSTTTSPTLLLKPHGRFNICSSFDDDEENDDEIDDNGDDNGNGNCGRGLHKMQVVSIMNTNDTHVNVNDDKKGIFTSDSTGNNSRKRRRDHDDGDNQDEDEKEEGQRRRQKQQLLIIAGERGLWSIPISDVLRKVSSESCSEGTTDTTNLTSSTTANNNYRAASLLQLSDRPIVQLQISSQLAEEKAKEDYDNDSKFGDEQFLYALEEGTNIVSKWNLQTVIKRYQNNNRGTKIDVSNDENSSCLMVPDHKFDLSRYFSGGVNASKSISRFSCRDNQWRSYNNSNGKNNGVSEHATTIFLVKSQPSLSVTEGESSLLSTSSSLSLLVGTNRSRLLVLPLPLKNNDDNDDDNVIEHHRFLSLKEESQQLMNNKATTTNSKTRQGEYTARSNDRTASSTSNISSNPVWKVTDIIATHEGSWWTVSATTKYNNHENSNSSNNSNSNTGLLVTWHPPTGMIISRQETREAIYAIRQQQQQDCSLSSSLSSSLVLYSASNEAAVTMWNSSFQLKQMGKFFINSPSSKAIAILQNGNLFDNYIAVAGVGNRIDLLLDHCRVQTVKV